VVKVWSACGEFVVAKATNSRLEYFPPFESLFSAGSGLAFAIRYSVAIRYN
jgi:hypothetical protein